jgi:beta-lactamase superfamily II metal-dependent hydrolase
MDKTRIRITNILLAIRLVSVVTLILVSMPEPTMAAGVCGTGSWQTGNLEIHHINIGQGDAALIVGPTGKSLLFDSGESNWNSSAKARVIGPYIEGVLGCKSLDYVVISHFHLDHIGYVGYGGLWHLVETQGFTVGSTLVRDYDTYLGNISGTFTNWKNYLEGVGQPKLNPVFAAEGSGQVDLGAGVAFNIVAVDGNGAVIAGDFHGDASPPSENDYSIGAVISYGNFDEWIGGDVDGQYEVGGFGYTYHDIELSVTPEVDDVDVYKVNHHGSSHSSSATFINQLDPEVSIVTVGNGNTYGHPAQSTMDRLLATSTVYLTERGDTSTNIGAAIVAGNIVIKTATGSTYTVNGTPFTATDPTRTDTDGDGYFAEADPNDVNPGLTPAPNGGCGAIYQTCSVSSVSCQVTAGQVVINEVFPSPFNNGTEWMELYNTTNSTINIGYCYIDDIPGASTAYQIPASTLIPAHGFWTLDRNGYFNNTGDSVRFLKDDLSTVLDSYTYVSNPGTDMSWYRNPDGGAWAASSTSSTTKGQSNTIPFYPIVSSINRVEANPTSASSVHFTVTFSKAVTGVNASAPFSDFGLNTTGVTGAAVSAVSGSGSSYTVTVNTGVGNGTIRLNIVDDDSIRDLGNHPLGGNGVGNGSFTLGELYTIEKPWTFGDAPDTYWAWSFIERLYNSGITSGCSTSPLMYCPTTTVTRDQMAVFLLRAKHGSSYVPPVATGVFQDVPTNYWAAAWIEQLAAEGITGGCSVSPKLYCPTTPVTRDQMAVFLLRAEHTSSYLPPAATGVFEDVPTDYWAVSWIEQLAAEGITGGCSVSPSLYCPTTAVSRDQMAVFLVKTFNLP